MATHDNQSYEVQVHNHGRWQTHARYPFHERAVAIREAKDLDIRQKGHPVRVVMEEYNPDTGRHNEILVYRNKLSPKQKPKGRAHTKPGTSWADMAVSNDGRVGYMSDDVDDWFDDPFMEYERPKASVNLGMFLAIMSTIVIIGVASGAAATGLLALLIEGFNATIDLKTKKVMFVGMFITVFFISSLSSLSYYRQRFDLNPFKKKKKKQAVVVKSKISKQMEKAAEEIDKMPVVVKTELDDNEEFSIFDQTMSLELSEPDETIEFSEKAEEQKMLMVNFLGTCLGALKGPDAKAENFNRFGLNLFMTGAVSRLTEEHDLTSDEFDVILQRMLEMLGAKPDQAERFIMEYDKYLGDPRHNELFHRSGDIVQRFASGDQSAALYIRETIEDWVNWKPPEEENYNPNLLTIMFTDMVGSTDLTTKHGDYAAQEVLRSHDMIVRTALANFEGTEIKHLGDGIMASFKDHDKALKAAIEIQKRVEGNNNAGPEFPLHVRIGLNAGEPIKKDNDLFGTSVQLAARLCDKTESDCINVSQDLKDLFGDKPVYTFIDLGLHLLKGFEVPSPIFQLDWKAPPIEYPDEDETELSEEIDPDSVGEPDHTAPDMAVQKPVKQVVEDPSFASGYPLKETAPAQETDEGDPKNV